jgi:uncharacterized protein (UPF0332 family)
MLFGICSPATSHTSGFAKRVKPLPLYANLLNAARILTDHDVSRPKQANLRRAVSSAYYALFHRLIAESVHTLSPKPKRGVLLDRMSRAFQHGEIKQVCKQFQQEPLPEAIRTLLQRPVSAELKVVTEAFLDLQEARHEADYDVGARLTRSDALSAVITAEAAFRGWDRVKPEEAHVFLVALAFGARWNR